MQTEFQELNNKINIIHKYIIKKKKSTVKKNRFFLYINIKIYNKNIIILKIVILLIFILIQNFINQNNKDVAINHKIDYDTNSFVILRRTSCDSCGLFSFYMVYLGCINKWITRGYIPIIDMKSFPNTYNNYNISNNNPWEIFFNQPFEYTLEEVINKAKRKFYEECLTCENRPNEFTIYYNRLLA